ncbi:amidase family protein [Streptomyces sp. NPDC058067]|uniref:amidase family protein n=1 Tax=Streptomyces sp. NPDC058067 TaxID=3346324 RepID=UPI0036F018D9
MKGSTTDTAPVQGAAVHLWSLTAVELRARLLAKEISCREVLDSFQRRIEEVNPQVNAIVTHCPERAREAAARADDSYARTGRPLGPLHGLPVAHKDLVDTAGLRTSYGSRVYAGHVPDRDALLAQRYREAGAILVGKTNTPEFGAGSHTVNDVFGATRNPYDLTRSAGGSSGGAAAALAAGMLPIADGSDMGGSLRNPAAFCHVVGLRPSVGRVPNWPSAAPYFPYPTNGALGRCVEDVALQMAVIGVPDPRAPLAAPYPESFDLGGGFEPAGRRVAFDADLGGLPVDPAVSGVLARVPQVLAALGCDVHEGGPGWDGADDAFLTWRAWYQVLCFGELVDEHRELLRENIVWNVDQGRRVTGEDLVRAEKQRNAVTERARAFLDTHEFLLCPTSQVAPFDIGLNHPPQVDGVPTRHYLDWMRACSRVTVTGFPAASVPFGFTDDGLPVGVQVVGRPGADADVLRFAGALQEAATGSRVAPVAHTVDARREPSSTPQRRLP